MLIGASLSKRQVAILVSLIEKHSFEARIVNHYGMSECLGLTSYDIGRDPFISSYDMHMDDAIPIGRPFLGRRCFLVDSHGEIITDSDIVGTIYVKGKHLIFFVS